MADQVTAFLECHTKLPHTQEENYHETKSGNEANLLKLTQASCIGV